MFCALLLLPFECVALLNFYPMNQIKLLFSSAFLLFSSALMAQDFTKIDSVINAEIRQKNIAGGVAYIIHNNKVVVDKAYGYADVSNLKPMQTDAIFRIASQTKAIISVAVLQLVEKQLIGLDDPIEKYIASFSNQKVALLENDTFKMVDKMRSITIRDLLSHQSGISSADEYPKFKPLFEKNALNQPLNKGFASLEEEVEHISAMPLVHQPGARFSYGLSTNVLGRLIELVSGLPLDQYLAKNIFRPLKMRDTYFYLPKNKQGRLVKVYMKKAKDSLAEINPAVYPVNYPLALKGKYFSAIGGLVSTTHDYALFLQSIYYDGNTSKRKHILTSNIVDQLLSNQLGEKTFVSGGVKSLNTFGLGVGLTSPLGRVINNASVGSFFWGGAFNTAYMVDRKRNIITLFYFQRMPFVLPPLLSKLEKMTIDIIDQYNGNR